MNDNRVMLSYNRAKAGQSAQRIHWIHALAVGVHALCCGLPIAVQALGLGLLAVGGAAALHGFLHAHEVWVLVFSASLVALGILVEWAHGRGLRRGRPSALLLLSAGCFLANAAFIGWHQAA